MDTMDNKNLHKFASLIDQNHTDKDRILKDINEMLEEQFIYKFTIDEHLCDQLIEYHNNNTEYKSPGMVGNDQRVDKSVKESVDVQFSPSSNNPAIKEYIAAIQEGYNQYVKRYRIEHFKLRIHSQNNIQYYPPGGGFKIWHWERDNADYNRQLVYMTYLNTVENGGTEWLFQDVKLEAKKGLSVIWPADFTFTHRGIVSAIEEKWIATGWFVYY